jgi:uncharacterized protein with GYD domain
VFGPSRKCRSVERPPGSWAKSLGVDIKAGYLAMGTYDLIIHTEATDDEAMAKFLLSLAALGNVRTTTVKVFPEADVDKIIAGLA